MKMTKKSEILIKIISTVIHIAKYFECFIGDQVKNYPHFRHNIFWFVKLPSALLMERQCLHCNSSKETRDQA